VAGSDVTLRRYLCLQSQGPRSSVASRPGAQGRPRPEHRKRRGSRAIPARGNRYREQRSPCRYTRSAVSARRSGGDMSTPQKGPPTRHYLQTTSDNRRSVLIVSPSLRQIAGHITGVPAPVGMPSSLTVGDCGSCWTLLSVVAGVPRGQWLQPSVRGRGGWLAEQAGGSARWRRAPPPLPRRTRRSSRQAA